MKRGTRNHPKTVAFAVALGVTRSHAVGLLECLWDFTSCYAHQGDVGRYTDAEIAKELDWPADDAARLIAILIDPWGGTVVRPGWLDTHPTARLLVHDWHVHADNGVRSALRNRHLSFVVLELPQSESLRENPEALESEPETSNSKSQQAPGTRHPAPGFLGSGNPDPSRARDDSVDVDQEVLGEDQDVVQVREHRLRVVQAAGNDELGIYAQPIPFPEAWRANDYKPTPAMARTMREGGCENPSRGFQKFRLHYLALEADMQRGWHRRWDLKLQSWFLDHDRMGCPCQRRPTPADNARAADERVRHEAAQRRPRTPSPAPSPHEEAGPVGTIEDLVNAITRRRMPAAALTAEQEAARKQELAQQAARLRVAEGGSE